MTMAIVDSTQPDTNAAAEYAWQLKEHAQRVGALNSKTCMCIARYGEDPETGKEIPTEHWWITEKTKKDDIKNALINLSLNHGNIYISYATYRIKHRESKNCAFVFGLVADFDDESRGQGYWVENVPSKPSRVIESSPGRYHVAFLLDEALKPDKAKVLAMALHDFTKCDHCTKDIIHVWRMPGLYNYPGRKKYLDGRRREVSVEVSDDDNILGTSVSTVNLQSTLESAVNFAQDEVTKESCDAAIQKNNLQDFIEIVKRDGIYASTTGNSTEVLASIKDLSAMGLKLLEEGAEEGERSEKAWRVYGELIQNGHTDDEIVEFFEMYAIGEKYREKGNQATRERWLRSELIRARGVFVPSQDTLKVLQHLATAAEESGGKDILTSEAEFNQLKDLVIAAGLTEPLPLAQAAGFIVKIMGKVLSKSVITEQIQSRQAARIRDWKKGQQEQDVRLTPNIPRVPTTVREITQKYVFSMSDGKYIDRRSGGLVAGSSILTGYADVLGGGSDSQRKTALILSPTHIRVDAVVAYPGDPREVIIDPEGNRIYNGWRDGGLNLPDREVSEDEIRPWLDVMEALFPEKFTRKHIMDWLSSILQNPTVKTNHQLGLYGPPEIGKDTVLEPIKHYFSRDARGCDTGYEAMKGDWDDWAYGVRFVCVQEVSAFKGRAEFEEKMKIFETSPPQHIRLNLKGKGQVVVPNNVNLVYCTNNRGALARSTNNQRVFIVECEAESAAKGSDGKSKNPVLEKKLKKVWAFYAYTEGAGDKCGMALVCKYLLDRKIPANFTSQRAPSTEFGKELSQSSKTGLVQDLQDRFAGGSEPTDFGAACFQDEIITTKRLVNFYASNYDATAAFSGKATDKAISAALRELGFVKRAVTMRIKKTPVSRNLWMLPSVAKEYKDYTSTDLFKQYIEITTSDDAKLKV